MKKIVFGFIIGVLVSGGVVYATTLIDSKDVTYTPSNNEFNANNVEDALDKLYEKSSNTPTLFNIYTSHGSFSNTTSSQQYIDIDLGTSNVDISKNWTILVVPENKSSIVWLIRHNANATTVSVMGNGITTQNIQYTSTPSASPYSPVVGITNRTITINTSYGGNSMDTVASIYYGID